MRFEVGAHARHQLQILNYGLRDRVADRIGVAIERVHYFNELVFEVGIVHAHSEVIVTALVHQIADALVHGNARGNYPSGH